MPFADSRVMVNPPDGFRPTEPVELCLWVMYNITPLYMEKLPRPVPVSSFHSFYTCFILYNFDGLLSGGGDMFIFHLVIVQTWARVQPYSY